VVSSELAAQLEALDLARGRPGQGIDRARGFTAMTEDGFAFA
jgi:hypothetical protein